MIWHGNTATIVGGDRCERFVAFSFLFFHSRRGCLLWAGKSAVSAGREKKVLRQFFWDRCIIIVSTVYSY